MSTDYCYMHIILLGILTIASGLGAIGFGLAFFNDTDREDQKKPKWAVWSLVCLALFGAGLGWWITSGNEPWRTEYMSLHDIKDVTYPDGTKVQMFACDGQYHNVTNIFGKVVEPKEWVVRRVKWSPIYFGVSWSSSERCQRDHFFLEHRNGTQPSVELNMPNKSTDGSTKK